MAKTFATHHFGIKLTPTITAIFLNFPLNLPRMPLGFGASKK
jgi:hypothetical protein